MLTRLPNAACLRVPAPVRLAHRHPAAPRAARSCVVRAAKLEKFVGCNCYYLLDKMSNGEEKLVIEILDAINKAGFTVVRTWGFNSDPSKAHPLQKDPQAPGNYDASKSEAEQMVALGINKQALKAFDDVLRIAHDKDLKLMICLTNSCPDYGGMHQFVRWAGYGGNEDLRRQFWSNSNAQTHCRNYITFMVTHVNRIMHENGWDCVHSWDICNEPRLPNSISADEVDKVTNWVASTADLVKGLDPKHPVTVGSEGFWGAADVIPNDPSRQNPYTGMNGTLVIEGSDWRAQAEKSSIDFVCIHPYADQWGHKSDALTFNQDWITGHVAACNSIGKQLVVQEYNMPAELAGDREAYFNFVKDELLKPESPLVGAMVWNVVDSSFKGDQYMIHPDTTADSDWQRQEEMCQAVKNRPIPS